MLSFECVSSKEECCEHALLLWTGMDLEKICDYLLKKYEPKAILLHGSRLRGDATDLSDYDLVLIAPNVEEVYPHQYQDAMLDLDAATPDIRVIETGNKVPNWPLGILYDSEGIGERICKETERAYKKGPIPLSDQEWTNRSHYAKRMISKIHARGHDLSVRRYYLSDFYMRVIRYWFEKRRKWTVSPYRALPIIKLEDPDFFLALQDLWTDSHLSALDKVNQMLFE